MSPAPPMLSATPRRSVPGSYRLRFVAPQPQLQAAVGLNLC